VWLRTHQLNPLDTDELCLLQLGSLDYQIPRFLLLQELIMTTAQFGAREKLRNFFGFKTFISGLAKQGTSTLTVLFVLFMAHSIHLLWALFSKIF
jgi:hypothetical protein